MYSNLSRVFGIVSLMKSQELNELYDIQLQLLSSKRPIPVAILCSIADIVEMLDDSQAFERIKTDIKELPIPRRERGKKAQKYKRGKGKIP